MAAGDLDAVAELLDPDVKWHAGDPTSSYACQNRDQALMWIRMRQGGRQMPELVDAIESGERVVIILQPPPTADDPHPHRTANLTTFRDGKVVEMVHYEDPDAALAVLR